MCEFEHQRRDSTSESPQGKSGILTSEEETSDYLGQQLCAARNSTPIAHPEFLLLEVLDFVR